MNPYVLLFWDSFRSMFSLSFRSETAWFAARDFGTYDITTITCICFVAGVLGALSSLGLGYFFSLMKDRVVTLDDELYTKLSTNASKYGIYIFLFQMMPFVKIFFLFAGIFRLPFKRMIVVTIAGRALYYLYYFVVYPPLPVY